MRPAWDGPFSFRIKQAFCFEFVFKAQEFLVKLALTSRTDYIRVKLVIAAGFIDAYAAMNLDGVPIPREIGLSDD